MDMDPDELLIDDDLPEGFEESLAQAEQEHYAATQRASTQPRPNKRARYSQEPIQNGRGGGRLGNRPIGNGTHNRNESFGVGNQAESFPEDEEESINNRAQIVYDEESKGYINKAAIINDDDKNHHNASNGRVRAQPPPNDTLIRKDGKLAHPVPKKPNQTSNGKRKEETTEFYSDDGEEDEWWTQADLNQVEQEAVKNSQQQQRSQQNLSLLQENSHSNHMNRNGNGRNQNRQVRTASPALVHQNHIPNSKNHHPQPQSNHNRINSSTSNNQNNNNSRSSSVNRGIQQRSTSGSSVGNASGLRNVRGVATEERGEDEKDRELRRMKEEVERVSKHKRFSGIGHEIWFAAWGRR